MHHPPWYPSRIRGVEAIERQLSSIASGGVAIVRLGLVAGKEQAAFLFDVLRGKGVPARIEVNGDQAEVCAELRPRSVNVSNDAMFSGIVDVVWNVRPNDF
ncbi:hypothetical protein [Pigmentiphaga litoralis]|uniref:hypothetical protein n=1 Tax=Pigmentiphaga litoralis TaxID=516702 RepID=UPI0016725383|nr:hypothetical protein [Pigmentiphaga litoralis]